MRSRTSTTSPPHSAPAVAPADRPYSLVPRLAGPRHDELDGRLGRRGRPRGPGRRTRDRSCRRPRPPTPWPSCARTPSARPDWSASSPDWPPPSAPRRCSWSTGRAGCGPTPRRSRSCSGRSSTSCRRRRAPPTGLTLAVGSKVTGGEVGLLLGFLASKVLGQFDPFHEPAGRLLLVAPNIVHVERELRADPTDFRLWVCLHEETHRVQFTAVPWMRDHLFSEIEALAETVDPERPARRRPQADLRGRPRQRAASSTCSARPRRRRSSTASPG